MWRVPFFNPLQRRYYEETVGVVERHMKAYSVTRDGVICPPTAPPEKQEQSFHLNAQKVEGCEAMVAILDYLGVDLVVQKQRTTEEGVALPEMDYIPITLPDSGCFVPETKVDLLTGESVTLRDLMSRDDYWVYSSDLSGGIVSGKASRARMTKQNAQILEVVLDNGEAVYCTTDHQWLLLNGEYIEAASLNPQDSLMPLYRRRASQEDLDWCVGYEMSLHKGEWQFTHRLFDSSLRSVRYDREERKLVPCERTTSHVVRHHVDFNYLNNSPSNLVFMTPNDHWKLHCDTGEQLAILWQDDEFRKMMTPVSVANITLYNESEQYKDVREEQRKRASSQMSSMLVGMWNDPEWEDFRNAHSGRARVRAIQRNQTPEMIQATKDRWSDPDYARRVGRKISLANADRLRELNYIKQDCPVCGKICGNAGALGNHMKYHHATVNHKVVSVRDAGTADVCCIPVDIHHNFALSAGVFVHNTVWEMGAAYIIGKPVIGLVVTPAKLNLMLARGTVSTAGSLKELDEQLGMIVPVLNNAEEYAKVVVELKSKQWGGEIV